jgi:hypothetical protein
MILEQIDHQLLAGDLGPVARQGVEVLVSTWNQVKFPM